MGNVSLHRLARREFLEALSHYRDIDILAARRFLDAYEQAVDEITLGPNESVVVIDDIRRKLVRRFPYSIFYYHRNNLVRIVAVAHQKRRPFYWLGRN